MEAKLDCGDNSCEFAENKTGMRTNGGCRCLKDLDFSRRMAVRRYLVALREENARLRARVEELERRLGDYQPAFERQMARAEAAEAKLARCVEALDRVLTEAGMQAHKHGCPERMRRPARWDEFAPCAGCQAEAVLAAAKGGE